MCIRDRRRGARPGEDVDNDEVDRAVHALRQLAEHLARVAVAYADARPFRQRRRLSHEFDEGALQLDDLLPAAGSGCLDVAGQRECAAAEVQCRDRLPRRAKQVDRMRDAAHVLEEDLARVAQVDVRLRSAVNEQLDRAGNPPILFDLCDET